MTQETYITLFRALRSTPDEAVLSAIAASGATFQELDAACRERDMTLMGEAIAERKFRVAQAAFDAGCRVGPDSPYGNEWNLLADRIGEDGALALGDRLLEAGVPLDAVGRKLGSTGLRDIVFSICTRPQRTPEKLAFLKACIRAAFAKAVFHKNRFGVSAWSLVHEFASEDVIELMEEVHGTEEREA